MFHTNVISGLGNPNETYNNTLVLALSLFHNSQYIPALNDHHQDRVLLRVQIAIHRLEVKKVGIMRM